MKIIRSNSWGAGIHSPFVYTLVASVIFSRNRFPAHSPSDTNGISSKEWERIRLIVRLIDFFRPSIITLIGGTPRFSTILSQLLPGKVFQYFPANDDPEPGFLEELVIWEEVPAAWPVIPASADHSCWIISDLKSRYGRILFEYLRNCEKVSVTLEFKQSGIAVFDKNLQKENYLIRRCFWS